jgi:general secretion pathway protein E
MPVLDVYDDKPPRRVVIEAKRLTIGRTNDNAVVIDDRQSSRIHCEIRSGTSGFELHDLLSRNGTMLNQDTIDRPAILRNGDEIGIGNATIRFWTDRDHIDKNAPQLPTIAKSVPTKTAVPAKPAGKAPPPKTHQAAPRPKGLTDKLTVPASGGQKAPRATPKAAPPAENIRLIESDLLVATTPQTPKGPLTVNHIIPLNAEGKPAHPVGKDSSEVSLAMLRLKELLLKSLQFTATDIHLEPKEEHLDIRYRIDGTLHNTGTLEFQLARPVFSIVKLLCNLDINKKNIMQDGSFALQLPDRRVDLRVSIAPSTRGDKMVLRILDKNLAPDGLHSLGMDHYILEQVRQRAFRESSMILVCGPTGSGKTTTVYAILQEMNNREKNIVTVEDPVEYKLDNVTQIQANPKHNITFASALTSLLRQDPDVILVGEIRDADTAHMALQSAMTGHLVLTTVHARDSIGSIFRLLDLGVEPFLLGSALTAVLAQRLLRKLCSHCKMKYKPAVKELSRLGLDKLAGTHLYAAVGCDQCLDIGYRGRTAIFEFLAMTDQVRDAVSARPSIQQLRIAVGDWIFQTLREDGMRKLKQGVTTLDDFTQVVPKE